VLASSGATSAGISFYLVVVVVLAAGVWKVFTKAGRPGWAAIVPVYNVYVLLQIAERPAWWLLFYVLSIFTFFVPPVSLGIALVLGVIVGIDIARRFGRGGAFGVGLGLLPFIFYPILGFGSARYQGEGGTGDPGGGGFCAHCGTPLTPGDAFCANCGASTTPA